MQNLGTGRIKSLIPNAIGEKDALNKLAASGDCFVRPVVWSFIRLLFHH